MHNQPCVKRSRPLTASVTFFHPPACRGTPRPRPCSDKTPATYFDRSSPPVQKSDLAELERTTKRQPGFSSIPFLAGFLQFPQRRFSLTLKSIRLTRIFRNQPEPQQFVV